MLSKLTKFQKIGAGSLAIAIALSGFIWYTVWRENRGDLLTVAFLNIGQGDAIFVEAPNGNQMIIDGGPNAALLRELGKVMPFYDRTIDVLIVTNPDKDHFAGFVDVLKRYQVDLVIESGTKNDSEIYKTFDAAVKKEGSKRVIAKRGMSLVLDDGSAGEKVSFDVIFPDQDVSKFKTNDGSIIGRLIYGDTSVMFTGDTVQKIEKRLVRLNAASSTATNDTSGTPLKSNILKIAHHGSKTSSLKDFVEAVAPEFAVISLGKNNKYGHPSPETIDTLDSLYIPTLRTDKDSPIIFESDGDKFFRK